MIFDIDGVVADVRHRLHLIERRPKDWDGFFAAAADDPALADGLAMVRDALDGYDVMWLTGRPERTRPTTVRWLARHDLPTTPLLMRRERDFRPARIAKRDALRRIAAKHEIALVVDDDPEVVAMLSEEGHPAKLADWLPRLDQLHTAQEHDGRT